MLFFCCSILKNLKRIQLIQELNIEKIFLNILNLEWKELGQFNTVCPKSSKELIKLAMTDSEVLQETAHVKR